MTKRVNFQSFILFYMKLRDPGGTTFQVIYIHIIHIAELAANRTFRLSAFSVFVYLCVKWRGDQAVAHDWSTLQCFDVCCLQAEER